MPIVGTVGTDDTFITQRSAVKLARYAQIIEKNEGAFWGVKNVPDQEEEDCGFIWQQKDRRKIAKYLTEAQEELEKEIRYPLNPKWIVGKLEDEPDQNIELVDQQDFSRRMLTRWVRVIEPGIRSETIIEDNLTVTDKNADPYSFTTVVAAPAGTTADEIRIYHENTFDEITPSSITINIVGNIVTVEVPRVRTVKPALVNNPKDGLSYLVPANFMDRARITRVTTDPSTNAEIVSPHTCNSTCATTGCGETTATACIYVDDHELGLIRVLPATFSGGAWGASSLQCCDWSLIRLYYLAGTPYLSFQAEDAIVRLAHGKMPDEPCGCVQSKLVWERDRVIPDILTRERINNPFGSLTNGAWVAWRWSQTMKVLRVGMTF